MPKCKFSTILVEQLQLKHTGPGRFGGNKFAGDEGPCTSSTVPNPPAVPWYCFPHIGRIRLISLVVLLLCAWNIAPPVNGYCSHVDVVCTVGLYGCWLCIGCRLEHCMVRCIEEAKVSPRIGRFGARRRTCAGSKSRLILPQHLYVLTRFELLAPIALSSMLCFYVEEMLPQKRCLGANMVHSCHSWFFHYSNVWKVSYVYYIGHAKYYL
jgi:hypothetical protein